MTFAAAGEHVGGSENARSIEHRCTRAAARTLNVAVAVERKAIDLAEHASAVASILHCALDSTSCGRYSWLEL